MRRRLLSFVLIASLVGPPWASAAPSDSRGGGPEGSSPVQEAQAALERVRRQASSIFDELSALELEVALLDRAVRDAKERLARVDARIEALSAELAKRGEQVEGTLGALQDRLRVRERMARRGVAARTLLSAKNLVALQRTRRALDWVNAADLRLLETFDALRQQLELKQDELAKVREERAARVEELELRRARALLQQAELGAFHAALLREQGLKERALREARQAAAELDLRLRSTRPPPPTSRFAKLKGQLPYPVDGSVEVRFGKVVDARFGTVVFQKGLDLRAPKGAPVVSVAEGRVVHSAPMRGYGNLVIIDHGEGYYSLYSHLDETTREAGKRVEAGDALGSVGETGSLKGPYLYFELREEGRAIDPLPWLRPRSKDAP